MKKVFLSILMCITLSFSYGQRMEKGMNLVNVGVGLFSGFGANVSYEHGIVDQWGPGIFSVGGFIGGATKDEMGFTHKKWFFAPRASYRYAINDNFEVYGTTMIGLRLDHYSIGFKSTSSSIDMALAGGCRYSFATNVSAFAELGYNVNLLNVGVTFSF